MSEVAEPVASEKPTGLEDVNRSLRALLQSTRGLKVTPAIEAIERELAMAISISENLRDKVVTPEALNEVRHRGLYASFRRDAHQALDLAADTGGVLFNSFLGFLADFANQRRPPLPSSEKATDSKAATENEQPSL